MWIDIVLTTVILLPITIFKAIPEIRKFHRRMNRNVERRFSLRAIRNSGLIRQRPVWRAQRYIIRFSRNEEE